MSVPSLAADLFLVVVVSFFVLILYGFPTTGTGLHYSLSTVCSYETSLLSIRVENTNQERMGLPTPTSVKLLQPLSLKFFKICELK